MASKNVGEQTDAMPSGIFLTNLPAENDGQSQEEKHPDKICEEFRQLAINNVGEQTDAKSSGILPTNLPAENDGQSQKEKKIADKICEEFRQKAINSGMSDDALELATKVFQSMQLTKKSDPDKRDEVDCSVSNQLRSPRPSCESNSIIPHKWLIRFFVNNHFIKDVTFKETKEKAWEVTYELDPRDGVDKDSENAKLAFEKIPSCEWDSVVQKNKSKKEILSMLNDIAERWNKIYDGLICIFSSHGTEGHIYGSDNELISIGEICAKLNVIPDPKLLFIQACQGSQINRGYKVLPTYDPLSQNCNTSTQVEKTDAIGIGLVKPLEDNFLLYFATTSEYYSYRRSDFGSIMFIFLFYEIFKAQKDSAKYIDIYDLITHVNEDMMKYTTEETKFKQMPVFVSTLTKRVKLKIEEINSKHKHTLEEKMKNMAPSYFYTKEFIKYKD